MSFHLWGASGAAIGTGSGGALVQAFNQTVVPATTLTIVVGGFGIASSVLANGTSILTVSGGGGAVKRGFVSASNFTALGGGGASYILDPSLTLLWVAAGSGGSDNVPSNGGCVSGSQTQPGEGGGSGGVSYSAGGSFNGSSLTGGNCTSSGAVNFGFGGGSGLQGGGACCVGGCTAGGGGSSTTTGVTCTPGFAVSTVGLPGRGWNTQAGRGVQDSSGNDGEIFIYW